MLNTLHQHLKDPRKCKIFWSLIFGLIWLGTNIYVIMETPVWSEKYITAFILGNICMFIAAAYMVFIYRSVKKIDTLTESKIQHYYKMSMWILGLAVLLVPFFFIIHVPDTAHDWDFFVIFRDTMQLGGRSFANLPMTEDELLYFLRYPNNQFFGIVYNTLFAPFTTNLSRIIATTVVAAILTSISVLGGSLIIKKISNLKMALIYNLVAFGFIPFYLYGAQLYTDTATLPFVIFGLLFMIYALQSEKTSKMIIWWIAACLVVFFGYSIKPTVFIPMIAVFCFLVLNRKWKKLLIMVPVAALLFVGVHQGVKAVIANEPAFSEQANDRYNLPMIHWVTMSFDPINKYGGFNPDVLAYSQSFTDVASKKEGIKHRFIENLKEMGVPGVLVQLWRKIMYTWFNGDLSNFFYTYLHSNPFIFRYFDWTSFAPEEGNITGWLLIKAAQTLYWLAIVPLMWYEIFLGIFKKHKTEWFIVGLSMAGLTGFLLLWEANSRYLYNFAPIMLILATMGLVDFIQRNRRKNGISE
ncbi:ArnT family glycosyltransferase [Lactococcus formosensis]|uniref:ArnT family glycosyltransferase n=1 Tax=Lactococcus formosensis TaxID=1281486 RepID=UPI00243522FB|nr:hypothetical protein [Lactococcus formosensis]MDG6126149.1 glycosyltransferase family 39 protein [Lactococcus formosensis]MDG6187439.1 glycosyltransferase family 39 protein [Lactococcus formosensis]